MYCELRFLSLRVEVSGYNTLPDEADFYFFSLWFCCCWASIFFSDPDGNGWILQDRPARD